jgi:lipoprotein-anchoring transpeptidase ErfK/SrfK
LKALNPDARFQIGDELHVPNVEPMVPPEDRGKRLKATKANAREMIVTIRAADESLNVRDAQGAVLFYAPVTVGSERDPLPTGDFTIVAVVFNPVFNYNPDLFWDADPAHAKAKVQPGPNNPVGYAWIDLNREHLGLHGTPEPSTVGKSQSHGCVRLTNWDVLRLAALVGEGTRVVLQ